MYFLSGLLRQTGLTSYLLVRLDSVPESIYRPWPRDIGRAHVSILFISEY